MHQDPVNRGIEWAWLDFGPEAAIALLAAFIVYAVVLFATTSGLRLHAISRMGGRTILRDLTLGLSLLALVPALGLSLVLASRAADQREERAATLLHQSTAAVAAQINEYFEKHRTGISTLSSSIQRAGRFDQDSLAEWIESHHAIYNEYLTMLAANSFGDIVAATAMVQGRPQQVASLRHNVSDRDYFNEPMEKGGDYVSNVFRGRGFGNDAIVAVSAAVTTPTGLRWGIVEGSLNLNKLERFRTSMWAFEHGAELLILDSKRRVIFATDSRRFPTLRSVPPAVLAELKPSDPNTDALLSRSADRTRLVSSLDTDMGWHVVATLPLKPIYDDVLADARVTVLWLLACVLAAAFLAAALSRRVSRPLQALQQAIRSLDLDGSEATIVPPPGAATEIRELFGHLSTVLQRIQNSYRQLTAASEAGKHYREQLEQTLVRRESEIKNRTRELEQTNKQLRTLSNVDNLTGLANRRCFLDSVDRAWRHGMREQTPVALVLIDIDYFKAYNDNYGHQAGDRCLHRVAQAMSAVIGRPLDLVARCGGEEFIMVLVNTNLDAALLIAERTRLLVEDLAIPHKGSKTDTIVTASMGVACDIPQRGSEYDDLIRKADNALYHSKKSGRNCISCERNDKMDKYRPTESPFEFHDNVDLEVASQPN